MEETLENLKHFLSIHALADFPEYIQKKNTRRSKKSYLADFPEELELGFH